MKNDPRLHQQRVVSLARATGLEPATTGSTVRYSNQLSYAPVSHLSNANYIEPCIVSSSVTHGSLVLLSPLSDDKLRVSPK